MMNLDVPDWVEEHTPNTEVCCAGIRIVESRVMTSCTSFLGTIVESCGEGELFIVMLALIGVKKISSKNNLCAEKILPAKKKNMFDTKFSVTFTLFVNKT